MRKLKEKKVNLSFSKEKVKYDPLKFWKFDNGSYLCIYQGSRGSNPELDFIVRYRDTTPRSRLRSLSHTHWVVDFLIKFEHAPDTVRSFFKEWLEIYDRLNPFTSKEERDNYELIYDGYFEEKYSELENLGNYSPKFVSSILELFVRCEKQSSNAFMFRTLISMFVEYTEGKRDFYSLISYSKRV